MQRIKKLFVVANVAFATIQVIAQNQPKLKPTISVESRISNLLQEGYEIGLFYNSKGKFSYGLQYASQNVSGNAKGLLFYSSNHDNLTISLPWLVAFKTRYHLKQHKEGFYAELSIGLEQFRVSSEGETHRNNNGFALLGIGYIWYPWGRKGFYVNPNLGYIYAFNRESEQSINGTSYELRPFFPSPAFSIGCKF